MTKIKRNDLGVVVPYTIPEEYRNLDGATVEFLLENKRSTALAAKGPADIIDQAAGHVAYTLTEGDTIGAGIHIGEFQVTYADGSFLTFPRAGYLEVDIQRNIDGGRSLAIEESIAVKVSLIDEKFDEMEARIGAQITAIEDETAEWRESVADDVLADVYEQVDVDRVSNTEVREARGGKTSLGERLDGVTAELAQTARKGEISLTDVDKNRFKIDQTYATDEFLQQIAGDTPINAVPADDSLTTAKYVSKSVTREKADDLVLSVYPFQPRATFYSHTSGRNRLEIVKFLKEIKIYGANPTVKYSIGTIRCNDTVNGYVVDLTDGTSSVVARYQLRNSNPQSEITLTPIANSGVTAKAIVDWSALQNGETIGNTNSFERTGLDPRTYLFSHDSKAAEDKMNKYLSDVSVLLPRNIYGVVGKPINIYFNNIIKCINIENLIIEVQASAGTQYADHWTLTPTSVTDVPITIIVADRTDGNIVTSASTILKVTAETNVISNKKVMVIGDSITNYGTFVKVCYDQYKLSDNSEGIEFLGVRGTAPYFHEGRPGWRADTYLTSPSSNGYTNDFWDGTAFNFSHYLETTGQSVPSVVVIALGTNDAFSRNVTTYIANLEAMINSIKAYSTDIKVVISTVIPSSPLKDPFLRGNHNVSNLRHNYQTFDYNKLILEKWDNGNVSGIDVMPTYLNLDINRNYPLNLVQANSRLAQSYSVVGDSIHPTVEGRNQMGDSYYYYFKNN